MAVIDAGTPDCQADAAASATIELHWVVQPGDALCEAQGGAGLSYGLQSSGACIASAIADATFDEVVSPCVATGTASATIEIHRVLGAATCTATGIASADVFRSDPANDKYELFHSTDGVFDFGSPVDTWTSPGSRELTASAYGAGTHYFVLRKRNQWGLSSQNIMATRIVIAAGQAVLADPSAPLEVAVGQVGSVARIRAAYYANQDGDAAANQWLVYVTTDGSDPAAATPIVMDMSKSLRGVRRLQYDVANLAGNFVRALIGTRRVDNDRSTHDSPTSAEVNLWHVVTMAPSPPKIGIGHFDPTQ